MANQDPTFKRLKEGAARTDPKYKASATLGKALGESAQTMTNWAARGVPPGGAVKAQRMFGVSATWILYEMQPAFLSQSQSATLTPEILMLAFQMARQTIEKSGQDAGDFDPEGDAGDARILLEALGRLQQYVRAGLPESAQDKDTRGRARDGRSRLRGEDGGAGGTEGEAKTGATGQTKAGKRRGRAA